MEPYDVIVAGAGPSGLCAAMAASRQGARVALVERFGIIGGNLTVGHVGPIMGSVSSGTMAEEINAQVKREGFQNVHQDIELTKIRLTEWLQTSCAHVFLNTPIVDVVQENHALKGVIVGTQNGLQAIEGKIIVDATGDGVVAYLAGAPTEAGRTADRLMQPASVLFTLCHIDKRQTLYCGHEEDDTILPGGSYLDQCKEACAVGKLPQSVNIVRLYPTEYEDERLVNATQVNHINGLSADDLQLAQTELRGQMLQIVDFLKTAVPGFENCRIKDSSDVVGIRETRRVIGDYMLQADDLLNGRKFEDVMVHNACFPIDIHNPDGAGQAETVGCPHTVQPYDIPYRCFVPKDVEHLYVAGRCISGTHRAHASYRVMNICMAMGEAIGIAASLCAKKSISPRELDYHEVQCKLIEKGIHLFK